MELMIIPFLILVIAAAALSVFLHFVPLGLWISALAAGVNISLFNLVGMRIRRVEPRMIVLPLIKGTKAGLDLNVNQLEAHYLAGGNVDNVVDALNNLNQKVEDAANGSWESRIDGETVQKVKAGDAQNFTSGDNIELSNDDGAIKIAAKKDVSFNNVTIGSGDSKMTLDKDGLQAGKVKVSSEEINAGGNRIQGVADGTEKDDAATVGQLEK